MQENKTKVTKRDLLKVMASIYDPCGILAPSMLPVKVLFQDTWKTKLKWESCLPEPMRARWDKWIQNMNDNEQPCMPR